VGHHVASSIWGHKFNAPFVDADLEVDATA
jgi:hypothetical protein